MPLHMRDSQEGSFWFFPAGKGRKEESLFLYMHKSLVQPRRGPQKPQPSIQAIKKMDDYRLTCRCY